MKRSVQSNFPRALRYVRRAKALPQEAFDQVSSRTYISALERGIKIPTLGKIEQLAEQLDVHPLTLLALAYAETPSGGALKHLLQAVLAEADGLAVVDDG